MNTTQTSLRSPRAFTLIELLIVIAIIGILMSLLFPAVGSAIDAARKAQAKNDVVQIATAVTAYETEYGKLPTNSAATVNLAFTQILTGQNSTENPRQIVFLEVGQRKPDIPGKGGKSGTNASGFVDPWGNLYQIILDTDYDNTISVTAGKLGGTGFDTISGLRKKVALFNFAASTGDSKDSTHFRKAVRSWE